MNRYIERFIIDKVKIIFILRIPKEQRQRLEKREREKMDQHKAVQYKAVQYEAVQYEAVQYEAVQYNQVIMRLIRLVSLFLEHSRV